MSTRSIAAALIAAALVVACPVSARGAKPEAYRPRIVPAEFTATIDNPYFPLTPGTTCRYTERVGKSVTDEVMEVTHETKVILGVTCVVVHDVARVKGEVREDTFDWYAQDKEGNVWYFGEATKEFHPGGKFSTEGSWEAGVIDAQPGIVMPAHPAPGAPYRQEYLRGHAEDMGQVAALGETVRVPYGTFTDCLRTKEWSMLEAGTEKKWYAKGIGCVRTESTSHEIAELVAVTKP